MLEGLQTEINKWYDLTGASPNLIMNALNAPGSAEIETWITNSEKVLVSINEIYTYYISDTTIANLISYLQQPGNEVIALRLDKATHLDMSSSLVINILYGLVTNEICTQTEYDNLIRLGQIKQSRAEELFGRKLTKEDFG